MPGSKYKVKLEKMSGKKILLISNGEFNRELLDPIDLSEIDMVIATDGAAISAVEFDLRLDAVIGDGDSLPGNFGNRYPNIKIVHKPSQYKNDLEKALEYCHKVDARSIILLGITGKRTDHTLNNFSVLLRYSRKFEFEIYDKYSQIFLVHDQFQYYGSPGQCISLIPMGRVEGITTTGLKYPLTNETLELGIREGLSNRIIKNKVNIKIKQGVLLVFVFYHGSY